MFIIQWVAYLARVGLSSVGIIALARPYIP